MESDHWAPLAETMWTQVPAVQVLAWRVLRRLRQEAWASDLFDMLYLDDETRDWAEQEPEPAPAVGGEAALEHRDAHGTLLASGDTVTLIKDLVVKGAGFTAKRGTAVRNITLVHPQGNFGSLDDPPAADHPDLDGGGLGVEGGVVDAEIGGDPGEPEAGHTPFAQVTGEPGRGFAIVLKEGRIAVDMRPEALSQDQVGAINVQIGMKLGPKGALHAVIGPEDLRSIGHLGGSVLRRPRMG